MNEKIRPLNFIGWFGVGWVVGSVYYWIITGNTPLFGERLIILLGISAMLVFFSYADSL